MADKQKQGSMRSLMTESRTFPPPSSVQSIAHVNSVEQYRTMWEQSLNDPDTFWLEQAKTLDWYKQPTKGLVYTWDTSSRTIQHTWFADGTLNVSHNCLDRHLGTPVAKKDAIVWQGEADGDVRRITYEELHAEVCQFANVLKAKGIGILISDHNVREALKVCDKAYIIADGQIVEEGDPERIAVNVATLYREFAGDSAPPNVLDLLDRIAELERSLRK